MFLTKYKLDLNKGKQLLKYVKRLVQSGHENSLKLANLKLYLISMAN